MRQTGQVRDRRENVPCSLVLSSAHANLRFLCFDGFYELISSKQIHVEISLKLDESALIVSE